MDITHITSLLGGVALFLYGMSIMGAGLEKLAGGKMQLWGVNTADWKAVDRFCEDKRIAGKAFRFLDSEELATLNTKLRAMNRKKDN